MEKIIGNWQLFALGSAIFAALTAIFGKIGVSELNSNVATFFRTFVVLAVSALLVTLRNEWVLPEKISQKSILFLVLSGVATGFSWLCYYKALQLGPASRVAPVDKLSVVFVIIIAALFLGEQITLKVLFGAVFIAVGAILIAT